MRLEGPRSRLPSYSPVSVTVLGWGVTIHWRARPGGATDWPQSAWPHAQRPLLLSVAALWLRQLLLQYFPFSGAWQEQDWCWHFMGVSSLRTTRVHPACRDTHS